MATETVTFTVAGSTGITYTKSVTVTDPVTGGFPGGYPDASTTGARGPFTTYTGPLPITTAGATFTNMLFPSSVIVLANNVTFRNCKFTDTSSWPLFVHQPYTGAMVDHCTFVTGQGSQCSVQINSGTVQYCDASGSPDGIRGVDGCTIIHNYVHDLYYNATPGQETHNDGIDVEGSVGNNLIQHNTVLVPNGTSCITLCRYSGTSNYTNNTIDNNLLSGGGYCIYGPGGTDKGSSTYYLITNNKFSKTLCGINHPHYGAFNWLAYEPVTTAASHNAITGNVDYETGLPIQS